MQNSLEILNYQNKKATASLKILCVLDLSNTSDLELQYYKFKALDLKINPDILEFIDYHDFLARYKSKDDFKYSLDYSDIVLGVDLDTPFIKEYKDEKDYYRLYPKLIYLEEQTTKINPADFKALLSHSSLSKDFSDSVPVTTNQFIYPNFLDTSDIWKRTDLSWNEKKKLDDKIFKQEINRERHQAKKILLCGVPEDESETVLLGIYDIEEEDKVKYDAKAYYHTYFSVSLVYIDSSGEELFYLTDIVYQLNHYYNVSRKPFSVKDKIEIQKSLGNIN